MRLCFRIPMNIRRRSGREETPHPATQALTRQTGILAPRAGPQTKGITSATERRSEILRDKIKLSFGSWLPKLSKFSIPVALAERKGFEPSKRFPVYSLSRGAPSTTRPPLREAPVLSSCSARRKTLSWRLLVTFLVAIGALEAFKMQMVARTNRIYFRTRYRGPAWHPAFRGIRRA